MSDADVNKILSELKQLRKEVAEMKRPRRCWVPAKTIMEITGWDAKDMMRARENKTIEHKKAPGGGFLYDINSLSQFLLKGKPLSEAIQ